MKYPPPVKVSLHYQSGHVEEIGDGRTAMYAHVPEMRDALERATDALSFVEPEAPLLDILQHVLQKTKVTEADS